MQGTSFGQRQSQRTIPVQIQASNILNMSLIELQQFIETESMENPALTMKEGTRCPVCGFVAPKNTCPVCGASITRCTEAGVTGMSERDYLRQTFSAANLDEAFDPFRTVASSQTLNDYLKQQARMCLGGRKLRIAEFLIESLDDDGYFRESLFETAEEFAAAVPEIEDVLEVVQGFDPPGIAARNLQECLLIQLRMVGDGGTTAACAERIISDCWDDFSRMKLKVIAQQLKVSLSVVQEACEFIRENLNPRPASMYRAPFAELSPNKTAAIVPDIIIRKKIDTYVAEAMDCFSDLVKIDETYEEIYDSMKSGDSRLPEDDCKHIREHVERVRCILDAIGLRKKTLTRVANFIAEYQSEFIANGPSYLKPLRQKDVARELGVHESTICRAVASKFCKLPSGEVISFEVFFDSALPVRTLISQLIARSVEPISDGEISKRLAEQGVTVARRTVGKYREQMNVLPYQLRAA